SPPPLHSPPRHSLITSPGLKPHQIRRASRVDPPATDARRGTEASSLPSLRLTRDLDWGMGVEEEEGAINGGEEGPGLAAAPHDRWVLLRPAQGSARPSARYKHAAEVVQDKLYVVGGSRNGRSLSDVQVFDFRTSKWSALLLSPSRDSNQLNLENNAGNQPFPALASHSMVKWRNMLLVVAGNSRASTSNKVSVWFIDLETNSWSAVDTYGKVPMARGGQSVTLVGSRLIMFGGEDNKRRLLSDLHVLDLETMIWEEVKTEKGGPAPRYDHSAAVYAEHYLLIFGGSSHSTCFNDLYLLDLQSLEWSQPDTLKVHI
uniref:Uncharacterized protein n=2 Tax=Aegilops tauschii subsp. strangulata TaxID=200361 RepID=A0A453Q4P2_AEGTS